MAITFIDHSRLEKAVSKKAESISPLKNLASLILTTVTGVANLLSLQSSKGDFELWGHQFPSTLKSEMQNLVADFKTLTTPGRKEIDSVQVQAMKARLEPYLGFKYDLPVANVDGANQKIDAPKLSEASYTPSAKDMENVLKNTLADSENWHWSAASVARKEGKVRDNYVLDGKTFVSIASDRVSALNIPNIGFVPHKGALLTSMTNFWLDFAKPLLKKHNIGIHIQKGKENIDPNVTVANKVIPLPVEVVVRRYITGTAHKRYVEAEKGSIAQRDTIFGDHKLAPGIKRNQKLDQIVVDPTTKGKDDIPVTDAQASAIVGKQDWDRVREFAKELFAAAEEYAAKKGIILADTKFEFGRTVDGKLFVIDEVLTPDSSRYWFGGEAEGSYNQAYAAAKDPESFDKDPIRRKVEAMRKDGMSDEKIQETGVGEELLLKTSGKYIQVHDLITGKSFTPDLQGKGTVLERVKANLGKAGLLNAV